MPRANSSAATNGRTLTSVKVDRKSDADRFQVDRFAVEPWHADRIVSKTAELVVEFTSAARKRYLACVAQSSSAAEAFARYEGASLIFA